MKETISGNHSSTEQYKVRPNERIAAFMIGILLSIVLLITSTQAVCFWIPGWWRNEYAKYDTPQYVTGEMSLDDAVYITEQMLKYCIGRLDTLEYTEATIDGVTAPFFTEREKLHLADCRNVFLGAVRFRAISMIVIIGLLIALYFSVDKRLKTFTAVSWSEADPSSGSLSAEIGSMTIAGRSERSAVWSEVGRILSSGYLKALCALIAVTFIIVLIGMHDFTYLFTKFHHVFFDNDLWILDPRHDNLVNVMQESVFSDAAVTIGVIWGAVSLVLAILSILRITRSKRFLSN